MALGARTTDVLETVLARTMTWAFGGVVAGVIGALFLAKSLGGLLFDIAPTIPACW